MNDSAKEKLIKELNSTSKYVEFDSKKKLYRLYISFKKEVNNNLDKLGSFEKAYIYLKDLEFELVELKKGYYHISHLPIQSKLFSSENEKLKKIY